MTNNIPEEFGLLLDLLENGKLSANDFVSMSKDIDFTKQTKQSSEEFMSLLDMFENGTLSANDFVSMSKTLDKTLSEHERMCTNLDARNTPVNQLRR